MLRVMFPAFRGVGGAALAPLAVAAAMTGIHAGDLPRRRVAPAGVVAYIIPQQQPDQASLLTLLGAAGVNYIMGVPGADDVMLQYQSTSFHDALYLRSTLGLRAAPEFEAWLASEHPRRLPLPNRLQLGER